DFIDFSPVKYSRFCLHPNEVITLMICFQHSGFRCLKSFYLDFAFPYLKTCFPNLPSYNRFVELQAMCVLHNFFFTKFCCLGNCNGVSFIDFFKLAVCNNKGIRFISKIRSTMKNKLMELNDKFMLKRRNIVETAIDQLKNIYQIEHVRHRSPINFFNNFLSAISAYCFKTEKPGL